MLKNLKIYYISENYINYLRKFDSNVAYNKNSTRPYIGIVYTYNNYNYFAPLSSPKAKHININPKALDIFKIDNGVLGVVNINNMIPTPIEELTEVLTTITDIKYKTMLENQLTFLNNNKSQLLRKINTFQSMYRNNHLPQNILDRCCNFMLLEEKFKDYVKS